MGSVQERQGGLQERSGWGKIVSEEETCDEQHLPHCSEGRYWLECRDLLCDRERDRVPSREDMLSRVVFNDSTCSINSMDSCSVPSWSLRPPDWEFSLISKCDQDSYFRSFWQSCAQDGRWFVRQPLVLEPSSGQSQLQGKGCPGRRQRRIPFGLRLGGSPHKFPGLDHCHQPKENCVWKRK